MRLRKQQRLALVILAVLLIGGAAGLVLAALQDKVAFFVTPTQVAEQKLEPGRRFRLGGLVVDGSIRRDRRRDRAVRDHRQGTRRAGDLQGLLPDLFRDGQGVVTQGTLRAGRRVRGQRGAGQARRELHAQGSGRRPEAGGLLERTAGQAGKRRHDRGDWVTTRWCWRWDGAGPGHPALHRRRPPRPHADRGRRAGRLRAVPVRHAWPSPR